MADQTVDTFSGRREQAFPTLSEAQLQRVMAFGTRVQLTAGASVWNAGDYQVPFHVVLDGEMEVVHRQGGLDTIIAVHGPGQFSGEIDQLADRRSLLSGRARTDLVAIKIERAKLRQLVQTDSELSELLMRAFILRRMSLLASHVGDAVIIGSRHSASTTRLQEFLTRASHPYVYVDVDTEPDVQAMLDGFHCTMAEVPVLVCRGEKVLKNPTNAEVAECLGFNMAVELTQLRDVVVVGAGPAGLAAAVYAASEGLDVLVLEENVPGGQAGSSSKIENYLGFPTGISGQALAGRAMTQAEKFGARITVARGAARLHCATRPYVIELQSGEKLHAKTVVIATGAVYRKLEVKDLAKFEGVGVYYGATFVEAQRCEQDEVIIVGGGNSAGQAAMYLSANSKHVHLMVRGPSLAASMSRYLIARIEQTKNITLHVHTQITELIGGDSLEEVTWYCESTKETTTRPVRHVFSMTGALPGSKWLDGCLQLDENGFILTGSDLTAERLTSAGWPQRRLPYLHETSLPGVFAVGDVRATSVKRVAAAVGEGSACIQMLHKVLAE